MARCPGQAPPSVVLAPGKSQLLKRFWEAAAITKGHQLTSLSSPATMCERPRHCPPLVQDALCSYSTLRAYAPGHVLETLIPLSANQLVKFIFPFRFGLERTHAERPDRWPMSKRVHDQATSGWLQGASGPAHHRLANAPLLSPLSIFPHDTPLCYLNRIKLILSHISSSTFSNDFLKALKSIPLE